MISNKEVVVLNNLNTYLAGETLLVRFSSFLQSRDIDFFSFCLKDSYSGYDLEKIGIGKIKIFDVNPIFYYLNKIKREELIKNLSANLDQNVTYKFVTFCFRDLYRVFFLSNNFNCS